MLLLLHTALAAEPYGPVADDTPVVPEVIRAPAETRASARPDNPLIQTGLTISKAATIGGAVGLGMLVVGSVVYASGGDQATVTAGNTLQTGGMVVLAASAPGYVAGPIVTAQGIHQTGTEIETWPGWTAVGLFAGAFALPALGGFYPDQQQILDIAGVGSAIGGAVLINTQEGMNRRALVIGPAPGGVTVGGTF